MCDSCCESITAKLRAADRARREGLSCPEALLAAYEDELGDKRAAAAGLAERLPDILGEPELCDVFAVTFSIIATLTGIEDGYSGAVSRLRREYSSGSCGSAGEVQAQCTLRMKDCVLMIQASLRGIPDIAAG